MPSGYTVDIARSMAEIEAVQWDACANPAAEGVAGAGDGERFNPFLSHAFLSALEESKSVGRRAGWIPVHVLVKDATGRLAAAAPAYLKTHSLGEYVFDHLWAEAYARAGLAYYPKLQVAVPFTPVTGRRLLIAHGQGEEARKALIEGLLTLREEAKASSLHITFPVREEWDWLGANGFLQRTGQQFHFINRSYGDFEACYPSVSEFRIARGLAPVEAGAQGEHKLARGYLATKTYSAHEIGDSRFARAIADYLKKERAFVEAELAG